MQVRRVVEREHGDDGEQVADLHRAGPQARANMAQKIQARADEGGGGDADGRAAGRTRP